jgi:signal transduction histidine kinase
MTNSIHPPKSFLPKPLPRLLRQILQFLLPADEPLLFIPADANPHLWKARERILTSMVRIDALLGILALAVALPLFISQNQFAAALIYILATILLWVMALINRRKYTWKVMGLLLMFFLLGLSELIHYGGSIESYIFFFSLIVFATLFRGARMGALAFALSLVTHITFGLLIVDHRFTPISLDPRLLNTAPESWVLSWLIFLLMTVGVSACAALILQSMDQAWKRETQSLQLLQEERSVLERRVQERTREVASARDQALSASHYKSELMARISHELRTPLGIILGYSELLKGGSMGPLVDKQKQALEEVLESTNHLTDLINDLLDQSYIESGSLQLENQPFTLRQIADHALGFKSKAEARHLQFIVEVDPRLPGLMMGDERRVRQIMSNLISNAIKFTEQGAVRVRLAPSGEKHWLIEVTDSGPGIPPEFQNRIFDPFWQMDGSIKRKKDGYGLGLSIVKQMTDMLGGEVSLQTTSGEGSTFHVIFPLRTPTHARK